MLVKKVAEGIFLKLIYFLKEIKKVKKYEWLMY